MARAQVANIHLPENYRYMFSLHCHIGIQNKGNYISLNNKALIELCLYRDACRPNVSCIHRCVGWYMYASVT